MKMQITTEKKMVSVINEMAERLEKALLGDYKVIITKTSRASYVLNIVDDSHCPIITGTAIETAIEVMNAYKMFYVLLILYHAGIYNDNGHKMPTLEITVSGIF